MIKKKGKLTEADFKQIKLLVDAKFNNKQIADIVRFSYGSILNVKKSPTWADFQNRKAQWAERCHQYNLAKLGKKEVSVTKGGTVIDPNLVHPPQLDLFQRSLLNKLTEMTQVLSDLNSNLVSKQDTKKKFIQW